MSKLGKLVEEAGRFLVGRGGGEGSQGRWLTGMDFLWSQWENFWEKSHSGGDCTYLGLY